MNPRRLIAPVLLTLLALALASCGKSAPTAPAGSTTPRLAVLSPALAIILRDLGATSTIVGRHGFDMVLDTSVPVVGDETGINYEALLAAHPTHIVLEKGAKGLPPRLEAMAPDQGWTIVALPMLSLDDVEAAVPALADVVGTPQAHERAAILTHEMDVEWGHSERVASRFGRTLILASTDPIGVMGPGSFHYDLLKRMGAAPVPEDGAPWITLSVEDLVRLDPDSILVLDPGSIPSENDQAGLKGIPREALVWRRVAIIRHPLSQTPSTALIDVAREIRDTPTWTLSE